MPQAQQEDQSQHGVADVAATAAGVPPPAFTAADDYSLADRSDVRAFSGSCGVGNGPDAPANALVSLGQTTGDDGMQNKQVGLPLAGLTGSSGGSVHGAGGSAAEPLAGRHPPTAHTGAGELDSADTSAVKASPGSGGDDGPDRRRADGNADEGLGPTDAGMRIEGDGPPQLTAAMEQLRGRAMQLEEQAEREEAQSGVAPAKLEDLNFYQEERQRLQQECTQTRSQRSTLKAKRDTLLHEFESRKLDRYQSRRERDMAEMAEILKQRFKGDVYGQLLTLAKPIQSEYQLALSVAMQRDLDSVVVSDEATAKRCIQVLMEERKPQMNFLPLDLLKVKPVPERLRQLGPDAKLALDLLDIPDRRLERAFQYALDDTVICDDEDAARSLAFGAQRLKVVTLQGTLITKRGTMTGGSAPAEARDACWEEDELTRLRSELEEVCGRLDELGSARLLDEEVAALVGEINSVSSNVRYMEAKESTDKVQTLREQAARPQEDAVKREPEAAKIQHLKPEIDAGTNRILADFSRRAGLKLACEYEELTAGRRRELRNRAGVTGSAGGSVHGAGGSAAEPLAGRHPPAAHTGAGELDSADTSAVKASPGSGGDDGPDRRRADGNEDEGLGPTDAGTRIEGDGPPQARIKACKLGESRKRVRTTRPNFEAAEEEEAKKIKKSWAPASAFSKEPAPMDFVRTASYLKTSDAKSCLEGVLGKAFPTAGCSLVVDVIVCEGEERRPSAPVTKGAAIVPFRKKYHRLVLLAPVKPKLGAVWTSNCVILLGGVKVSGEGGAKLRRPQIFLALDRIKPEAQSTEPAEPPAEDDALEEVEDVDESGKDGQGMPSRTRTRLQHAKQKGKGRR
ncbi:hypothetical protein GPECTOR_63g1 [Gonium pectorale]|uniref:SMC hinge domain-containing protein n=1 Tax=Gonium pectorale TaxID=33097 RepID=A0A150G5S8_GONPE|nr:hypothetical protein GPECTOR_63g1 [Gonium pectorale]|eukprot:KXZ44680.1 hypothetical protein GPECTOR_63g1 [Gonium pectorale]